MGERLSDPRPERFAGVQFNPDGKVMEGQTFTTGVFRRTHDNHGNPLAKPTHEVYFAVDDKQFSISPEWASGLADKIKVYCEKAEELNRG